MNFSLLTKPISGEWVLHSYKNWLVDLQCKLTDWFLLNVTLAWCRLTSISELGSGFKTDAIVICQLGQIVTVQKMKFSMCGLVTFTEEILWITSFFYAERFLYLEHFKCTFEQL